MNICSGQQIGISYQNLAQYNSYIHLAVDARAPGEGGAPSCSGETWKETND